ncbi:response regulator [Pseudorhodobacter sp. W20_MBD10_FR17]|uniref:response regulator n=1 Tax=Pseudorhodobacter sp. W20_MBD10_FR17 TaxID=3240266 RepID=UPI003F9CC6DB
MIRLLHVEDDQDIREIAEMALDLFAKFELTQCVDGFDALKTLETFVPDIILLDMMMPNMTGVQLLEKLRLMPHLQDVPVVFMTARVQAAEVKALIDCGAVGVIVKPFDPIALSDQIEKFYNDNPKA